ncbi:hypothetical protein CYLTODRAFT_443125 [Cylindrobasidium torrendii FP15055 ss-10]|uniref:DUF6699 domain-containing protein n=1 Tax=Cylindrobasidium torrendii FP15055 ss-10 TaxID=1314674 RepID=A0A0D7BF06_9AGAR|nr:hypothetical protein CYLTODRAFT_443125 [Cylindrobasidium torrendii FP15055 ss-10]
MSHHGTPFIPPLQTPEAGPSMQLPPDPAPTATQTPHYAYSPFGFAPPALQYTPGPYSPAGLSVHHTPHTPQPTILPNGLSSDYTGYPDLSSDSQSRSGSHLSPWPGAQSLPGGMPPQAPPTSPWGTTPTGWPTQPLSGFPTQQSPYAASPYAQLPQQAFGTPWGSTSAPLPGSGLPPGFIPMTPAQPAYSPYSPSHAPMPGGGAFQFPPPAQPQYQPPPQMGGMGAMGYGPPPMAPGVGLGISQNPQMAAAMRLQQESDAAAQRVLQAQHEWQMSQAMLKQAVAAPPPPPELPMGRERSDRMPKFTAGPHYGPVLPAFLVHRLQVIIDLNPILMPMTDDMEREYLKWDIRHRTNTVQSSKDHGNTSWSRERDEPATWPRILSMSLVTRWAPFIIPVHAHDESIGVTCGEVIEAISNFMSKRSSKDEFESLAKERSKEVTKAYYYNRSTAPSAPGGALGQGMLKMDFMCDQTMFGGIRGNAKLVLDRYAVAHPCVWELATMNWPLTQKETEDLQQRRRVRSGVQSGDVNEVADRLANTSLGGQSSRMSRRHSRQASNVGHTPLPSHSPSEEEEYRQ